MKDLSIADILAIEDKPIHKMEIEEWNGVIYVRTMDAEERSQLEDIFAKIKVAGNTGRFRKEMLKRTLVKKDGTPMLEEDVVASQFMKKNSQIVERIFEKCCELNGFRERDVETLKKK